MDIGPGGCPASTGGVGVGVGLRAAVRAVVRG